MSQFTRFAALCCLASALATACSSAPRITYYSLESAAPPVTAPDSPRTIKKEHPMVSVESVTVPEMMDRLQLVTRTSASKIEIQELHRWAEPLKSSIPRIVADNLSHQLESDRVTAYPQNVGADAAYRIFVDFQRFESEGTAVSVDAHWKIRRTADGKLTTGRVRSNELINGSGNEAVVAAYSRALTAVSSDIARGLRAEWGVAARPCSSGSDASERLFCQ